jgi:hypothetical protein
MFKDYSTQTELIAATFSLHIFRSPISEIPKQTSRTPHYALSQEVCSANEDEVVEEGWQAGQEVGAGQVIS